MNSYALELNNDIKGLNERKEYIESLISKLESPDLILLPELALCSYIPNQTVWKYADYNSKETSIWAMEIARRYNTFIGVGYIDFEEGDYYNRYLIADKNKVYGFVTKSEAEAAVFKRGKFSNIIKTPFGNVAVGICYDSRRKYFYDSIKEEKISLIVFPHGSPYDPKKDTEETKINDYFCNLYLETFKVPVIYINSTGKLEHMPGMMGRLMKKHGFTMNGKTKIYTQEGEEINSKLKESKGYKINLVERKKEKEIMFYGNDLIKGNTFFRHIILKPDIFLGIRRYKKQVKKVINNKPFL